jgi:hypothetical protein
MYPHSSCARGFQVPKSPIKPEQPAESRVGHDTIHPSLLPICAIRNSPLNQGWGMTLSTQASFPFAQSACPELPKAHPLVRWGWGGRQESPRWVRTGRPFCRTPSARLVRPWPDGASSWPSRSPFAHGGCAPESGAQPTRRLGRARAGGRRAAGDEGGVGGRRGAGKTTAPRGRAVGGGAGREAAGGGRLRGGRGLQVDGLASPLSLNFLLFQEPQKPARFFAGVLPARNARPERGEDVLCLDLIQVPTVEPKNDWSWAALSEAGIHTCEHSIGLFQGQGWLFATWDMGDGLRLYRASFAPSISSK